MKTISFHQLFEHHLNFNAFLVEEKKTLNEMHDFLADRKLKISIEDKNNLQEQVSKIFLDHKIFSGTDGKKYLFKVELKHIQSNISSFDFFLSVNDIPFVLKFSINFLLEKTGFSTHSVEMNRFDHSDIKKLQHFLSVSSVFSDMVNKTLSDFENSALRKILVQHLILDAEVSKNQNKLKELEQKTIKKIKQLIPEFFGNNGTDLTQPLYLLSTVLVDLEYIRCFLTPVSITRLVNNKYDYEISANINYYQSYGATNDLDFLLTIPQERIVGFYEKNKEIVATIGHYKEPEPFTIPL